ncbi:hypothetical protein F5B20DRAFT_513598 [Whalleya microplaca]|nr:hypothetical protein F5B20DRAFT_513598 [Whalleya microplaca]
MGRPPAYIFIVRHGKRLDAADRQWHLSSPTPYDPPLTYGGWMQSKAVGARIASIIQDREAEDEAVASYQGPDVKRKKRRYKVVVHSSPFLRCVQTSVAICASLASSPPNPSPSPSPAVEGMSPPPSRASRTIQTSSFSNPAPTPSRPTIPTHTSPSHDLSSHNHKRLRKTVLRLDPFLGEWMTPDYFEHITSPPRSTLMLANAKAELLRRENYNDYPHFHTRHVPSTPTTNNQLWSGSPRASLSSQAPDSPRGIENLSGLKGTLPRLRSDSVGTVDHRGTHNKVDLPDPVLDHGYIAPVPSYALSTSEPIPRGYVAHARDACVDVDYQWDSTRDNLAWGNAGVLPEEWAAMHQRFRKGLKRLVEWYTTAEHPADMVTKIARSPKPGAQQTETAAAHEDNDDEYETENIVVLVSHGAGCNALIGAITQQPVLADVAMSSITMAQRRPEFDDDSVATTDNGFAPSLDKALIANRLTLSEIYELRLFANTEHLHSSPSTMTSPAVSRSSSTAGANNPRSSSRFNNNHNNGAALKEAVHFGTALYGGGSGNSPAGSRSNSINASLGSIRRGSQGPSASYTIIRTPPLAAGGVTVGSGVTSFAQTAQTRPGSVGLWMPKGKSEDEVSEKEAPMLLDFSLAQEAAINKKKEEQQQREEAVHTSDVAVQSPNSPPERLDPVLEVKTPLAEEHDKFDDVEPPAQLWTGNGGLWGSPRPPGEAERLRDFSSAKRRWTVNER